MKLKGLIVLLLLLSLAALTGTALAQGPVHWSYEGQEGPANWGDLSPDFALCSMGNKQSPINIPPIATINPTGIIFNYQDSAVNILNNGHTIQVNYDQGSSIEVDGKTYNLLQFHFHAVSEHTLDNQPSDLEMHLVHQSDDGQFAVVGVMMNRGAENAALASVWSDLPAEESEAAATGATVNAANLLPADQAYYNYSGSFTTPPCTEGVNWFVMANPIAISDGQAAAFEQIFSNNYRPVQPLNERAFLLSANVAPETLPVSGGSVIPFGMLVIGAGTLIVGTGLYLRRRKTAQ